LRGLLVLLILRLWTFLFQVMWKFRKTVNTLNELNARITATIARYKGYVTAHLAKDRL
jgi:hypothetical protein